MTRTILGKLYNSSQQIEMEQFVQTIPRFSYRKGFKALNSESHYYSIKSDRFWGCCIRCGQSMLVQHLLKLILAHPAHFNENLPQVASILSYFNDTPDAIFSIHNICKEIINVGGHEGEWVTVSMLALTIKSLLEPYDLPVYVVNNSVLVIDEIKQMMDENKSVLCLIPTMCGLHEFDQRCHEFVASSVTLKTGNGFISGIKAKARYFVGVTSKNFYYFDPHTTLPSVTDDSTHNSLFELPLEQMKINEIAPSILVSFTLNNMTDLEETLLILSKFFLPITIVQSKTETPSARRVSDSWEIVEM